MQPTIQRRESSSPRRPSPRRKHVLHGSSTDTRPEKATDPKRLPAEALLLSPVYEQSPATSPPKRYGGPTGGVGPSRPRQSCARPGLEALSAQRSEAGISQQGGSASSSAQQPGTVDTFIAPADLHPSLQAPWSELEFVIGDEDQDTLAAMFTKFLNTKSKKPKPSEQPREMFTKCADNELTQPFCLTALSNTKATKDFAKDDEGVSDGTQACKYCKSDRPCLRVSWIDPNGRTTAAKQWVISKRTPRTYG
ncbi:MAG: hypothetical protein Q9226_002465 [Calogaya cf. arnoldii]